MLVIDQVLAALVCAILVLSKKEGTNSDYSSLTTYTLCFNKRFISNAIRPAKLPPIIDIGRHFVSTD